VDYTVIDLSFVD